MVRSLTCQGCGKLLFVADDDKADCPECGTTIETAAGSATLAGGVDGLPQSGGFSFSVEPMAENLETSDNPYQAPQSTEYSIPHRDAAPLDRALAGRLDRFLGSLVDGMIYAVGAVIALIVAGVFQLAAVDEERGFILVMYAGALPIAFYQWYLIATTGQSLGKKVVGTRIVDYGSGVNPGFLRAVVARAWLPGAIGVIPCAGPLFSLINVLWIFGREHRCLHDYMAGTKVIQASSGRGRR